MKNRIYSWIFISILVITGISVALTGSVAAQSTGYVDVTASDLSGSGTTADPYVVTNASELQAIEDDLDADYTLDNDIDASDTSQWNGGNGFDPVGDGSGDFKGNFDGNGFQITQLTIDRGSSGEEVGLFGEVDNAVIESVHFDSANITGNRSVGALAGFLEQDTTVRRVSANGSVSGEINTGGLIGSVEDSTVEAASTTGNVTGSTDVGGLAGQNVGGVITQSSSQMTVTATGEQQGNGLVSARAGGLIGGNFNNAITNQSYATGSVSGRKVGGITGENYNGSQIAHTYAAGSVDEKTDTLGGGVVGDNLQTCPFQPDSQLCENYEATSVVDSYWDTNKTGQSTSDGSATGLTTTQMQGQAAAENMDGFDFDNTWTTTSEYPALRALSEADENVGNDSSASPQVQLSNITLTSQSVDSDAESTHRLSFEAQNVSADGNKDEFDITFPDNVELVNYSDVAIDEKSSGVEITDNTLEFSVNPTGGGSTQISGELNVTVSATN